MMRTACTVARKCGGRGRTKRLLSAVGSHAPDDEQGVVHEADVGGVAARPIHGLEPHAVLLLQLLLHLLYPLDVLLHLPAGLGRRLLLQLLQLVLDLRALVALGLQQVRELLHLRAGLGGLFQRL